MAQSTAVGLAVLVLAAFVGTSHCQGGSCPDGFVSVGEKCYQFSDSMSTWEEGRAYCQGLVEAAEGTADLAVFAAHYVDFSPLVTYMETEGIMDSFWVGLTDVETESEWIWLDGRTESLSSITWACDLPEQEETSNCAALFTKEDISTPRIQMKDQSCFSADVYSLCEFTAAVKDL